MATWMQFPGQVWKLPTFDRWYVIANGLERVHDIGRASEEDLSGIISFEGVRLLYPVLHSLKSRFEYELI